MHYHNNPCKSHACQCNNTQKHQGMLFYLLYDEIKWSKCQDNDKYELYKTQRWIKKKELRYKEMKETHTPFSVFFHVQSGQVFDCYDKKVTMTFTTTLHWEHYSHTLEDL